MVRSLKKFAQYVLHFMLGYFYFFLFTFFNLAFRCRCLVLFAILSFLSSSSFITHSFLSFFFIAFLFLCLITSYYLLLLFLSFGLSSIKISENILIDLYSQRLSACNSSNTAGKYYYSNVLQFVVTFRFNLKSDKGDGHFAGRPMLVYAYISTATR